MNQEKEGPGVTSIKRADGGSHLDRRKTLGILFGAAVAGGVPNDVFAQEDVNRQIQYVHDVVEKAKKILKNKYGELAWIKVGVVSKSPLVIDLELFHTNRVSVFVIKNVVTNDAEADAKRLAAMFGAEFEKKGITAIDSEKSLIQYKGESEATLKRWGVTIDARKAKIFLRSDEIVFPPQTESVVVGESIVRCVGDNAHSVSIAMLRSDGSGQVLSVWQKNNHPEWILTHLNYAPTRSIGSGTKLEIRRSKGAEGAALC